MFYFDEQVICSLVLEFKPIVTVSLAPGTHISHRLVHSLLPIQSTTAGFISKPIYVKVGGVDISLACFTTSITVDQWNIYATKNSLSNGFSGGAVAKW